MKQKSHSAAKRRFRVTKNGKVVAKRKNRSHLLEKKSSSRKRRLKRKTTLDPASARTVRKLLNR